MWRSKSLLSCSICSSKMEWSTTAEAPASSMSLMLSMSSERGDAEGTRGVRRVMPIYFVRRSIYFLPGKRRVERLLFHGDDFGCFLEIWRRAFAIAGGRLWSLTGGFDGPASHVLVELAPVVHVGLGF